MCCSRAMVKLVGQLILSVPCGSAWALLDAACVKLPLLTTSVKMTMPSNNRESKAIFSTLWINEASY
jgi:hypothetical protein